MAIAACGLVLSACGSSDSPPGTATPAAGSPTTQAPTDITADPVESTPEQTLNPSLPDAAPSHCPPDLSNCRTASGRILYIEAIDPDGDGDAHFILASTDSITAPGLSIIDISKDLRPPRLPHLGTSVSAAGPVYPGHLGQSQIQAFELHIAGRK